MYMAARRAVIAGVADAPLRNGVLATPATPLGAQATVAVSALADAGLTMQDVDGLLTAGAWGIPGTGQFQTASLAEYLGINPCYADGTNVGGAAFEVQLGHAAMAIEAGRCDVALITYASTQRSGPATKRDPLTVQDVLDSPLISDPLHVLDCCLVTDGAGAVVVTSADRARDHDRAPVEILGWAEAQTHWTISQMPDLISTAAARTGPAALAQAGLKLDGLAAAHPGMYGIFLIIEACRQLWNECGDRQVAGARTALVHGTGGQLSSSSTCILSTVRP
jgi:acetyl-CoA acetyltransferase